MSAPNQEPASLAGANPGGSLRAAREQKGWSLQLVAQQLNLPARSVEQLEANEFSRLPGHTFARGYVRAYAKLLGEDPNRLINEFDRYTGTDATGSSAVQSLGRIDEPGRLSRLVMRVFGFILLLILLAASLYWWQERSSRDSAPTPVSALERIEVESADGTTQIHVLEDQPEEADITTLPLVDDASGEAGEQSEDAAQPELEASDEPAANAAQASGEEAAPAASEPLPETESEQPSAMPPASVPPAEAEVAPVSPAEPEAPQLQAGEGRLELRFVADCWVRVTDADGRELLSTLAKAGSERTLTGRTPLNVHLGFARGAVLTYNGNPVDVTPYLRGQTARLTLGQ
ncbi:RodZ domain-containing protein [Pseudomonas oligotrophica]|uniref:RodZ domain-containing protein n=1 Tax=Pseudomonas oligotrophica TaxID=2912055 RepID=UPI001F27B0DB|nr:RodZ family helix-turn-helix domain-containing protein [Pseudomonas oligotrophica]MCF7202034.1 helix-turn-helix domain-containing protein [Pseudomonas oligotrophica]